MKIKVCGMKNPENIRQVSAMPVDYLGFIFYNRSPRFAGDLDPKELNVVPEHIVRTGVFVNSSKDFILKTARRYNLKAIQLHGAENPDFCHNLKEKGFFIIKSFSISEISDFDLCTNYAQSCDYFLFDTKTPAHGGSGIKFDWTLLSHYHGTTPFFLSGGISPTDFTITQFKLFQEISPLLFALDINSRFEIEPGMKDVEKLKNALAAYETAKSCLAC
jgi:phosphoribosylanthranilate isomerase